MQTRQRPVQQGAARPSAAAPAAKSGIPNSAVLAMAESRVQPEELAELPSRELSPSARLLSDIQARLGVPMQGMRLFETEGLREGYGQRAYAQGNEIHLARGEYSPNTGSGMELILHEASHIVQQGSGMARGSGILQDSGLEAMANGMTAPAGFTMPASAAGMPIQGRNPFRAIRRSHHKAMDALNNNRTDYDNMSMHRRLWWSIKNPLARMRASRHKNDTQTRNHAEAAAIDALKTGNAGIENTAEKYDILRDAYYQTGGTWANAMPKEGKHADAFAGEPAQKWGGRVSEVSGAASAATSIVKQLEGVQQFIDVGAGGVDVLAGGADVVTGISNAVKNGRTGNVSEASANAIDALGGLAAAATGAGAALSMVPELNFLYTTAPILPGAAAVTGGIQTVAGAVRSISGAHAWRKMSDRLREKKNAAAQAGNTAAPADPSGIGDLSNLELKRTLKQARSVARARTATGALSAVGSGLNAAAGVTTASGVGAMVGLGLTGAATLTKMTKWAADKAAGAYRRKHTVDKELGLDDKIEALMSNTNLNIKDRRLARQYALKSMGFETGTRKEAFANITMHRAAALHKAAEDTSGANAAGAAEAQAIIRDMGLYRHKGHYSLQGIAAKLGMDPGESWKKQLASANRRNPFVKP